MKKRAYTQLEVQEAIKERSPEVKMRRPEETDPVYRGEYFRLKQLRFPLYTVLTTPSNTPVTPPFRNLTSSAARSEPLKLKTYCWDLTVTRVVCSGIAAAVLLTLVYTVVSPARLAGVSRPPSSPLDTASKVASATVQLT